MFDLLDAALGRVTDVLDARRTGTDLWHVTLGHENGRVSTSTLSMHTPTTPPITDFAVHGEHGFLAFDAAGEAQNRYAALLDDFVELISNNRTEHPLDVRRGLHLQRLLEGVTDQLAGG